MAVIHQLSPASPAAREDRVTWRGAPLPDGSRRTFRGADAHAVVQAWLRAKEEVREQMRMLCKTIRILDRRLEMAEYSRSRRASLKAQGICQCCGKEDAEPGFIQCRACRLYNNQRRSGARTALHSPYGSGRRAG